MNYSFQDQVFWAVSIALLGACIGSFLNVIIYRLPLGISVNKPKRSFCPLCKEQLTVIQNIPIVSWFFLKGKCGHCAASIPFRYPLVELLTAILFAATCWLFPLSAVPFLCIFIALLIVITWIDADHMIIPISLTFAGSAIGLLASVFSPQLSDLADANLYWQKGLINSLTGWCVGFFGLWAIVEIGKKAFGKLELKFDKEISWHLKESEENSEPMLFIIDEQEVPWWDIFSRQSDQLVVDATDIIVDGKSCGAGELKIKETQIELPDGQTFEIADLISLSGKANGATVPREAMGMGDPHLLGMVGALLGWSGALFAIFAAAFIALAATLIARVGFGKPLPFGPFIAAGALIWIFGGWQLWQAYLKFLGFGS